MSEAQGTASMWLRMLGLEDLWKTANSPDFQGQIAQLVAAILETRIRVERIEYKLDALLDKLGHDDIVRRHIASLPAGGAGNGARAYPVAGAVADHGAGADQAADGAIIEQPAGVGEHIGGAGWRPY